MHNCFIQAIETWLEGSMLDEGASVGKRVHRLLGEPDAPKRFLASFLGAVLVAQRGNLQARIQEKQ